MLICDNLYFRCGCGRLKDKHFHLKPSSGVEPKPLETERWSVSKHTENMPTDAYGTIEFQGGPHPTKAQVTGACLLLQREMQNANNAIKCLVLVCRVICFAQGIFFLVLILRERILLRCFCFRLERPSS